MTTAAVSPTLGSAPVSLQAGNYSAIDDRRFWGATLQEGALSSGSYQVIQRAAGANMSVDVTSSTGNGALVQGDSVTAQGLYFVPPTSSNLNVTIAAADATNPRNDLVVLEVKDDQHDAGSLNLTRLRVITGTANASAALSDQPGSNGTPALPSSCMLLAIVRVAASSTTVTTAAISDRRAVANPAMNPNALFHVQDQKTAGTNGGTFTSGSFQTRTLNTSVINTLSGASLASNQITLQAGTYFVDATAPAVAVNKHKMVLFNVTDSTNALIGQSLYSDQANNANLGTVSGQITITSQKVFELRHRCDTTKLNDGLGVASNYGVTEIYADVKIWRTA